MRRRLTVVVFVLVASCGTGSRTTSPAPTTFSLHEWGVIAVPAGPTTVAGMALSGAVAPYAGGAAHALDDILRTGISLKPVIYVHLEGGRALDLSVRVGAPGGAMLEALPRSAPGPSTEARWGHLHATEGACASTPPTGADLCNTEDHVCEAREDFFYDADGGACLHLPDGTRRNHLFYRSRVDTTPLPFAVVAVGDAVRVTNVGTATVPGPALRIGRAPDGRLGVTRFDPPAPGHDVLVAAVTAAEVDATRAALVAAVCARGLDAAEAAAFDRAWAHLLFHTDVPRELAALPAAAQPPELAASGDVLLYLLPDELAARILPLGAEPRPTSVRRALFVRQDVTPVQDGLPPSMDDSPGPRMMERTGS